ncbi:MAG TPA: endonuclease MutS2 [Bacteroidota bacterium]|nr:endonuclease MutS2 [Bacteroidota bacterium]
MMEFQSAAEKLEFAKILNRLQTFASSDLGKRAAEHIVPSEDLDSLALELNRVTEMKSILEGDEHFPVEGLKDIRESLQRARVENSILPPIELLPIGSTLLASRNIKSFLNKRQEVLPEIFKLSAGIFTNKILEFNISQAIDENGLICDSASKELHTIRGEIISMYESLRKQLARILKKVSDQGLTQDDIITTREGRMVIPVKVELKNNVPGFIHSSSASGSTVYIEPAETLSLNNEIRELHFREQREIEKILKALTLQVREVSGEWLNGLAILEHIDLLYAKAKYSIEIKGNKPFLKDIGSLKVVEGRHPVLLMKHQKETIVPLSLEIGTGFTTLLITGPNAGGKSVALKTIGTLVLMLQSGLHVPAGPDSEFPLFSKIYADIGDDQSIENDLSTFSSHIVRLKEILSSADSKSLVLLDEIGAGTDPVEGGALAAAILGKLTKVGALTIATTHHVALKAFAHETEGIENGAMEFDQKTITPTYKFRLGVPGSSYALEIARRLGLPASLINEAEKMTGEQKTRLEKLIIDLETRSQDLADKLKVIEEERLKLNDLTGHYESKLEQFKREIATLKAQALDEAKQILSKANSVIEQTVLDIRKNQAEKRSIVEGKRKIKDLELQVVESERSIADRQEGAKEIIPMISAGSKIRLKSGGQTGLVLQPPDANGIMQVAIGSLKLRTHAKEVEIINKDSASTSVSAYLPIEISAENSIDVRGLFGEEALRNIDKFLDSAMLSGLHRVDIIHGKGTGALKKKIATFLGDDSRIKSYRLGEWNEGGAGVTVVELRDE